MTKDKIPYVNIWVENENKGTTSNEHGAFTLNNIENTVVIIFSAIGYETKKVNSELIKNTIELKSKIIELQEIVIRPIKHKEETVIGGFEKSKIYYYFSCSGAKPYIVARYFEFNENYNQTPFLKKIRILTRSRVKDSKFNVRLYSVNKNGEPSDYIYVKNIIGIARKGKRVTKIDISELNIKFPENGFFIAIEWLIVESNKHEYTYTMRGSNKKLVGISYEPFIGTIPSETDENSWIFRQGKWSKINKNKSPIKSYKDKYNPLAIELTLTN
jgi:hypothetical protein